MANEGSAESVCCRWQYGCGMRGGRIVVDWRAMLRELFRIPGTDFAVYSYGLMLVIAILAAVWLAKALARRRGMDPELFVNAGLLALVSGVVGARLSHVLENWSHYMNPSLDWSQRLWMMINIREGGLTYYGGFLLAFPVLVWYGVHKKVSVRVGMDVIAPCLMVGLAFGRIGCLLNGCCYGQEYNGACAVTFPYYSDAYVEQVQKGEIVPPRELLVAEVGGQRLLKPDEAKGDPELLTLMKQQHSRPVHATQVYSSITGFLIAGLLLVYMPFAVVPGSVFALMLMIEPVTRFLLEMLRVEPAVLGPMSLSMVLAIPQFVLGVALWLAFRWYHRSAGNRGLA